MASRAAPGSAARDPAPDSMPPGRAAGESERLRGSGRGPAVCEVAGRSHRAPFAGSVPGVRRRRPPGLGIACAAAALRAGLQIPDPREARPHRSATWAPCPLHSYDRPSHSLASGFPLTVSKALGPEGARGCCPTGGGAKGTRRAQGSARGARCFGALYDFRAREHTKLSFGIKGIKVRRRLLAAAAVAAAVPLLHHLPRLLY